MAEKTLTLAEFLGTNDKTYTWQVPSIARNVVLRRLTHGEVKQLNQDYRDAGNLITQELQDKILVLGMVEPAVTVEELQEAVNRPVMFGEIYTRIGLECSFLAAPAAPAPANDGNATDDAEAGDEATPDPLAPTSASSTSGSSS